MANEYDSCKLGKRRCIGQLVHEVIQNIIGAGRRGTLCWHASFPIPAPAEIAIGEIVRGHIHLIQNCGVLTTIVAVLVPPAAFAPAVPAS